MAGKRPKGACINSISDGEKELLDRASGGEPLAAKSLIERYLKLVFGFSLSFAPFSREQAFNITVASFAKVLRGLPRISKDGEWLEALFRESLVECARTAPIGTREHRNEPLKTVHEALFQLSSSDKGLILLRDQCHFSFETIAAILGVAVMETRSSCLTARERLRGALKELLEGPPGDTHGL